MNEKKKKFIISEKKFLKGIPENFNIDQNILDFGASKLSADIMVQEYGRYFNLKSCSIRAGCITGPHHSGVNLWLFKLFG